MDRYGHLFPDHMEMLAQGLEATFQKARVSSVCPSAIRKSWNLLNLRRYSLGRTLMSRALSGAFFLVLNLLV